MKPFYTLILLCAAAMTAAAQPYSQPVREVDDFQARNAVEATCVLGWSTNGPKGTKSCNAYTVPAGKRFAVRAVSFSCVFPNTVNAIRWIAMSAANVPGTSPRYVRLSSSITDTGGKFTIGNEQVFAHYDAGALLHISGQLDGPDPMGASCYSSISGFLISMN